jgi:hypothetical protein
MDSHWKNKDFIAYLYRGGYFHIVELILLNLTSRAMITCQKVNSGKE